MNCMDETQEAIDEPDHEVDSRTIAYAPEYVFLALFGILGIALAALSIRIGIGTITRPGPGLWPLIVSTILILFSVLALIAPKFGVAIPSWAGAKRAGIIILSTAIFAFGYRYAGFIPMAAIAIILIARYSYDSRWPKSVITGSVGSLAIYFLFGELLSVPLTGIAS